MAAPGKYTPERVKPLLEAIRRGATYARACAIAGISDDTFTRWRKRYAGFADEVKKAEAECVNGALAVLWDQAINHGSWQALAWLLERRYPREYGKSPVDDQLVREILVTFVNDWRRNQAKEHGDTKNEPERDTPAISSPWPTPRTA